MKWKSRAKKAAKEVAKEAGLIGLALIILAIYEYEYFIRKHNGRR